MSAPNQSDTYLHHLGERMIGRPQTQETSATSENPEIGKPAWGLAIANEFTGHLCIAHAPVKKIYRVSPLVMVKPTAEHPLHSSFKTAKAADLDKLWDGSEAAEPVKVGEVARGFYREEGKEGEKERPLKLGVGRVVCVFDGGEVCFVRSRWEGKK
jgi:hypothetical protein